MSGPRASSSGCLCLGQGLRVGLLVKDWGDLEVVEEYNTCNEVRERGRN